MTEVTTTEPTPGREGDATPHANFRGDWDDDDGQAIDDYFAHPELGPDSDEKFDFSDFDTTPITRLVTRTLPILEGMEPIQLLPRDTNRIATILAIQSRDPEILWLRYSDSKSGSYDGAILSSEDTPVSIPHNGDVWIHVRPEEGTITSSVFVSITSVTL